MEIPENVNCTACGGESTVECRPAEQASVCIECGRRYSGAELRALAELWGKKADAFEAYFRARETGAEVSR